MRTIISRSRLVLAVSLASVLSAGQAAAQNDQPRPMTGQGSGVELRPFAGGFIPTGDHRDLLKDAAIVGGQIGWRFHPNFAVTGSLGFAPSKDRTSLGTTATRSGREEKMDVWQYDIGVEARMPLAMGTSWTASPYVGLGAGGRSYDYRDRDDVDMQTNVLGYGALGVDIAPTSGPLGLRIEVRDNVTAFKGLRGELAERTARNDMQVSAGLTWRF